MTAKAKTAPVRLHYAVWDAEGNRHEADTVADLPLDQAKALIAEGKADRADPMPGDE